MPDAIGLPEVVAFALAVRIVWSVAWVRFGVATPDRPAPRGGDHVA